MPYKRYSISIDEQTSLAINTIVENTGKSEAEVTRELIKKGLANNWVDESEDIIASIVRQQMEVVLKPHIERLAKLSSKSGHMSATAAFLNVQALMDLVPDERRRNTLEMYESARKKAAAYMKTKTEDWDNENLNLK